MKTNKLTIFFRATNCKGFPSIKVLLDKKVLLNYTLANEIFQFDIELTQDVKPRELQVERYGKTDLNNSQILEIVCLKVDNVPIPNFLLTKQSKFKFNNEIHIGTQYFDPNGLWTFDFCSPIITYILDQKILHEAQYNQDYLYPWSYKLGPDSVSTISSNIVLAKQQVSKL